jgi:hemerythrin
VSTYICNEGYGIIFVDVFRKNMNQSNVKFEWSPDISVGDDDLDRQHQMLLGQINSLIDYVADGMRGELVDDAILFLDRYINEHFVDEEAYMRKHNYPHIDEHIELHRGFADKYVRLKEKLEKGVTIPILIADIEIYLGRWWLEHIGVEDKKYALFVESQLNNSK